MGNNRIIPIDGYDLPLWDLYKQFRSTALAYMKRENVSQVKNQNGEFYSLNEIENELIGNYHVSDFNTMLAANDLPPMGTEQLNEIISETFGGRPKNK